MGRNMRKSSRKSNLKLEAQTPKTSLNLTATMMTNLVATTVLHFVMYILHLNCSVRSDHLRTEKIPDHEHIGMHRPRFHYNFENRTFGKGTKDEEEIDEWYRAGFKAENEPGVVHELAKDHPDYKWVIMWERYKIERRH
jgi:hypothetical protein